MAQRIGPFVVFRDRHGTRHAIRLGSIQALCDADETDTTILLMSGGKCAVVEESLEAVLLWFS